MLLLFTNLIFSSSLFIYFLLKYIKDFYFYKRLRILYLSNNKNWIICFSLFFCILPNIICSLTKNWKISTKFTNSILKMTWYYIPDTKYQNPGERWENKNVHFFFFCFFWIFFIFKVINHSNSILSTCNIEIENIFCVFFCEN